jgi:hypothetical protein
VQRHTATYHFFFCCYLNDRIKTSGSKIIQSKKNKKIDNDLNGDFDALHGGIGIIDVVYAVL